MCLTPNLLVHEILGKRRIQGLCHSQDMGHIRGCQRISLVCCSNGAQEQTLQHPILKLPLFRIRTLKFGSRRITVTILRGNHGQKKEVDLFDEAKGAVPCGVFDGI